jgi:acetate---CoA ligase (ADP-forming)
MKRNLTPLLHPASIVFIGGAECDVAIRKTRDFGFSGKIWAVHPTRDEVGGIRALRSIADLNYAPDAAFIAVKREPSVAIVRELRKLNCGSAVIYASGFAETGNADLQRQLLEAADGMPLLGPNCYGFVNGLVRAALWPDEHGVAPCEKGIAIITQSGNIACNFTFTRRAAPVAAVYAIGNQADIGMAEMVEAFARDDRITAIGLHVEGLSDIHRFAEAATLARASRKPIVVLKTGRSEQGAKVALSHTSSLAGADQLYDALFRRYGVARVDSITAFMETLKVLHYGGPLNGNRLISLSCSGGEAALAADLAIGHDLTFPRFDGSTAANVKATLNDYVVIDNPLDYHTFIWNQPEKLEATFTAALHGGFDMGMLILDTPSHPTASPAAWHAAARAFARSAKAADARAAIVATFPESMPLEVAEELSSQGVVPLYGLNDAMSALDAAAAIGKNWAAPEPQLTTKVKGGSGDTRLMTEFEAKALLAQHGLSVPKGKVCRVEDAARVAAGLGFPVAIKMSSAEIAHKTEAGGVALNLRGIEEADAAARRMRPLGPEVLVEEMTQGAVAELIIGLKRDPQFGLALVIGAGGVLAELLKDSATLLLPASREDVTLALQSLRVWKLIEGFRGKSGDAKAAVDAVMAVLDFAKAHSGSIEELDVNPLLILPQGAVAVDALIRVRKEWT